MLLLSSSCFSVSCLCCCSFSPQLGNIAREQRGEGEGGSESERERVCVCVRERKRGKEGFGEGGEMKTDGIGDRDRGASE